MNAEFPVTVKGRVELPEGIRFSSGNTLYVRVEDVSKADGTARRLGEQVITILSEEEVASGSVEFAIPMADPGVEASCAIRAHLDLDGDHAVSRGDYVSTERISVLPGGRSGPVTVRLKKI